MSVQGKIEAFFETYPERLFEKGEVLARAGEIPASFFVENGLILQCAYTDAGGRLVVNTYKKGAFISLVSILNQLESQFFFEAAGYLVVREAPSIAVKQFLEANPDVTIDALARISRGSDGLMMRLAHSMEGSATERILQELRIIGARFNAGDKKKLTTIAALAAQTGLARETVSRTMRKLKARGTVVKMADGSYSIT